MESIGGDLSEMRRTPLHERHVERLRELGERKSWSAGEIVVQAGDRAEHFIYVEDGEVEVLDPLTGERRLNATLGATQFMGEMAMISGGAWFLTMRTVRPTHGICVDRHTLLDLMREMPEMSDIVLSVFAARRRRMVEEGDSMLQIVGAEEDRALRAALAFAGRNRLPVRSYPLDSDEARTLAKRSGVPEGEPFALIGEDERLKDPSPATLSRRFGLDMDAELDGLHDVLIVGGGPAGVSAGVYAGAEGLSAVVVEDLTIGGQAGTSSRIENYMGFPTGISGADLCWRGEVQAMKFGTRFAVPRSARSIRKTDEGFCVGLDDGDEICAKAVVVATGVQYRRLPIDRLEEFEGAGIYYAATEVEARFCKDTEVVVIGGGNSAGQAAMFLSRTAGHVHVLVRGSSLADSMSDYLLSRLEREERVTIHFETEMTALHGEEALEAITVRDKAAGEERRIDTRAVFVMVGAAPNTGWLEGHADLDERGFVLTGGAAGAEMSYETSCPGIFAVGDVRAGSVKRVASSVGEGSVVISQVWERVRA